VTSLTVGHTTPVSIASGMTLSGAITVTGGSIKLDEAGTLGSSVSMSGGTLDADETLTLSGALTQAGNITIDVAEDKTLTYSGAALSLGAYTLTMSGEGRLSNSNALVLNNASSKLLLSSSITVDNVSTSADSLGLDVDADSTVTSLSVGHATPVSIADGITLSGGIAVTAGSIKLGESGTLGSSVTMSGGTILDVDDTLTISGTLTQSGAIEIDVKAGEILTYSGAAVSLGAYTLKMSGGGTLSNTNALVLNYADSLLSLAGILTIGDVDGTAASNSGKGILVSSSATLGDYDLSAESYLAIANLQTLAGQLNLKSGGELNISGLGRYTGDIALAGGKFSADDDQELSGTLSDTADSELAVSENYTLTLSQTGGLSLGANTLTLSGGGSLVSGGLTLNDADSKLLLNSITVGSVSTSAVSLGLDVDANSTVTSLTVGHLATPVSIADGITLSGGIAVTGGSIKLGESGTLGSTVTMSGGTILDVDDTLTISGTLTQGGSITIDVKADEKPTYSGAAVNLGANTLTLSGEGRLSNSNALVLNNASSKLLLSNSITVDNVRTSLASLGLDVDADSTVTSLTVGHTTPVSIASGRTLSGAITVTAGSLKLAETGTLASSISMSGGTLDADNSSTLSGTLTQSGNMTIDVATGKTLTYSGTALSLGAYTLTMSGGGTLSNTNALDLNNASSKLLLSSSITVDNVSTSADNSGLDVDNNSTVSSLTVAHTTPVSIASGKTLSGAITVTDGSIKQKEAGTLGSTVSMSGGTLDADESMTLSGALSHSGSITIDVASGKTLTYSGASLSLGAYTLTLSGGGTLSNSNDLVLNNASSKLLLSSSVTVGKVSTSADNSGLDVDDDSTVTSLTVAHTTPVSIASGKTLSGAITVTAGSIKLGETGTLASTVSMSGGTLDADNTLPLSGALSQSGDITIDVADN